MLLLLLSILHLCLCTAPCVLQEVQDIADPPHVQLDDAEQQAGQAGAAPQQWQQQERLAPGAMAAAAAALGDDDDEEFELEAEEVDEEHPGGWGMRWDGSGLAVWDVARRVWHCPAPCGGPWLSCHCHTSRVDGKLLTSHSWTSGAAASHRLPFISFLCFNTASILHFFSFFLSVAV
jgi:hypothetical protein